MIVVDANVIAYFFIPGEVSFIVEKVAKKDPEWVAPLSWRSEFRNILVNYLRVGRMPLDTAFLIADKAEHYFINREFSVPTDRVLDLSFRSKCSAYDCEYVALAEDLKVPLVTTDQQILKAFPRIAISPQKFAQ